MISIHSRTAQTRKCGNMPNSSSTNILNVRFDEAIDGAKEKNPERKKTEVSSKIYDPLFPHY